MSAMVVFGVTGVHGGKYPTFCCRIHSSIHVTYITNALSLHPVQHKPTTDLWHCVQMTSRRRLSEDI